MATSKTKTARHKRLLTVGYLPDGLPPTFVSKSLGKYATSLLQALKKLPNVKGDPWYFRYVSNLHSVSLPRYGHYQRRFSILNPIAFLFLSHVVADNWVAIRKTIRKSRYTTSAPVFDWHGERAILRPNFSIKSASQTNIAARFTTVLTSDITRFYHSIYTHSISWAYHGKAVAKANRQNLKMLGNQLDTLVRNAQDGQTIGLPVGPDTSRVIAELVASSIDQIIESESQISRGDLARFVDDFVAGCNNTTEGERTLTIVRRALRSLELEANEAKSAIRDSHEISYESWRHELRGRVPSATDPVEKYHQYFDSVFALATQHREANVCSYGIKIASDAFVLATNSWPQVENFLLISYRKEPASLPLVVRILVSRRSAQMAIDEPKIRDFALSSVDRLVMIGLFGELLWILFLCIDFRILIKASRIERLFKEDEPLVALQICHMEAEGLISGAVDKAFWNQSSSADGLKTSMWLYSYEATLKGWSGVADVFIRNDPQFSELQRRKISFYDPSNRIGSISQLRLRAISASRRQRAVLDDFMEDFDLDIDDIDLVDITPEELEDLY